MWQLVRGGVENGQLVLIPASKELTDIGTIETVANVPGKVHVQNNAEGWRAQVYRMLTVGKIYHFQSARQRDTEFAVSSLLTDTEANTSDIVNYTNTTAAVGANTASASRATLTVSRRGKAAGAAQKDNVVLKVEASSFGEMCAKNPDEVRKYIEPIFRELDLDGVFFVNLQDAQHTFAATLPLDPKMVARVQALLPRLDDDSPDVRLVAETELKALGEAGVAPVKAIDLTKQPHQTSATLRNFLDATGATLEDVRLSNTDFLLLCLPLDDPQIPAVAKARLEKLQGKPVYVDPAALVDERRKLVQKILFERWAASKPPQTQK